MLAGSPSAAVRRRGGHEDVRQSQSECQFTHLPPEQEVLRKIKERKNRVGRNLVMPLDCTEFVEQHKNVTRCRGLFLLPIIWWIAPKWNFIVHFVYLYFFSFPRGDCKCNIFWRIQLWCSCFLFKREKFDGNVRRTSTVLFQKLERRSLHGWMK